MWIAALGICNVIPNVCWFTPLLCKTDIAVGGGADGGVQVGKVFEGTFLEPDR